MNITKNDIRRFNRTNLTDICIGNDNYNLAKGYCKYDVYRCLMGIRTSEYGIFSKGKPITEKILKNYPQEVTLI